MRPLSLFDEPKKTSAGKRKRGRVGATLSSAEELFAFQAQAVKLPPFEREWMFAKTLGRRWRFDFAFIEQKVAVEVEGLVVRRIGKQIVVQGRHGTVTGFKEDCIKYASAAVLGWTVLRFEQTQVKAGTAIEYTMQTLAARGWDSSHVKGRPPVAPADPDFDDDISFL